MFALTIRQPWAWCIVFGPKRVENRTWCPLRSAIGQRIAIHAGKLPDRDGAEWNEVRGVMHLLRESGKLAGVPAPTIGEMRRVSGAIIGTAVLARICRLNDGDPMNHNPWRSADEYGWVLEDVKPCPPQPRRGVLGLWEVPNEIVRKLEVGDG